MAPIKKLSFSTPHRRHYEKHDLEQAVAAVRGEKMSLCEASAQYNIPKSTLSRLWKAMFVPSLGRRSLFSKSEEQLLQNAIHLNALRHLPMSATDIISYAEKTLERERQETGAFQRPSIPHEWATRPDGNIMLTRKWWLGFLKRNPEVRQRVPEALSAARSTVSETSIREWFQQVEEEMLREGYAEVLQDASRIFNLDEFGAVLCPLLDKVVSVSSMRTVSQHVNGNEKEQITIVANGNAAGTIVPEMYIFDKKKEFQRLLNK